MAREYLRIDEWERWIPDLDNERKLHPDKALSMELRFMTREERKRWQRMCRQTITGSISDEENDKAMRALFRSHVRAVRGYVYDGDEVTTGEELFEAAEDDLCVAVVDALMCRSSLEAGLAKKLSPPSDSSCSELNPSEGGGAADVTQASPETTRAA